MLRILFLAAAAFALNLQSGGALAQTYPQRTVKFILPFGPASGTDITARLVGDRLSARWGKPVVIENRPGGDGLVAINAFISANDDHTLLWVPVGTFAVHPFDKDKLPYDADRDLIPVANVSTLYLALSAPASLGVGSFREFFELVRANPGKYNAAAANGNADFLMSGFLKSNNLDMAKVPYRDIMQGPNDLAENRIQLLSSSLAIVTPLIPGRQDQDPGGDRPPARGERAGCADRPRRPATRRWRWRASAASSGRAACRSPRASRSPPTCAPRWRAIRASRRSCNRPARSSMSAGRRSSPPASRRCRPARRHRQGARHESRAVNGFDAGTAKNNPDRE